MIGWRARFGVIVPATNTTCEPEFYRCLPEGVSAHFTRMEFTETSPECYERMIEDVGPGTRMLGRAGVDAVLFGCTSGSFYKGLGYDQKIISIMKEHATVPVTTTSTAVVAAFKELNIKKVAVATPYEAWVNELERKFMEASGIEVLNIQGLERRRAMGEIHPETLYRFARAQDRPTADALFLSCMNLRTLEMVPRLERELGKPVLSSVQSALWMLLRLCNIPLEIPREFGSLLGGRTVRQAQG